MTTTKSARTNTKTGDAKTGNAKTAKKAGSPKSDITEAPVPVVVATEPDPNLDQDPDELEVDDSVTAAPETADVDTADSGPDVATVHQVSPAVTIKQSDLNRALGFAKATVLTDAKSPLGYIHLAANAAGLTVEGYNQLAGARAIVPLAHQIKGAGDEPLFEVLVPTGIVELVTKEPPDSKITLCHENRFLVVNLGDDEFRLKIFPQAFPQIPFPASESSWESEGFIEALKTLCQLVGDEGDVLIQIDEDGGWQLEGNQGTALLVYYTPAKAPTRDTHNFKFHAKTLKSLLGCTGKVNIAVGDAQVGQITAPRMAIESDGITISCEMLMPPEGKSHASYRGILSRLTGDVPALEFDPTIMLPKVERGILLTDKASKYPILQVEVTGQRNPTITLIGTTETGEGSQQYMPGVYISKATPAQSFRTNGNHLKNALGAITSTVAKMVVTSQLAAISGGNLIVVIGHIQDS